MVQFQLGKIVLELAPNRAFYSGKELISLLVSLALHWARKHWIQFTFLRMEPNLPTPESLSLLLKTFGKPFALIHGEERTAPQTFKPEGAFVGGQT